LLGPDSHNILSREGCPARVVVMAWLVMRVVMIFVMMMVGRVVEVVGRWWVDGRWRE
jgi:hypothetical protein